MSRRFASVLFLILLAGAPARAQCDAAGIRAQIDRAKEARDDFHTFEYLDEREGADQICRYIARLATARESARGTDCAGEAQRLGAYAQRLLDDAYRAREAFLKRQASPSGSALHLGGDFCLH